MRYFLDTEFLEDGRTIDLISIGIVSSDGREYYAVNRDFRWSRIARRKWWAPWKWETRHQWLADWVVPSLPKLHGDARIHYGNSGPLGLIDWLSPLLKPRVRIADGVRDFLLAGPGQPELWAYYGAYDHVVLCQLWGTMMDLPAGVPMWTNDIKQEFERLGRPGMPAQDEGLHNALADARHNKVMYEHLVAIRGGA